METNSEESSASPLTGGGTGGCTETDASVLSCRLLAYFLRLQLVLFVLNILLVPRVHTVESRTGARKK